MEEQEQKRDEKKIIQQSENTYIIESVYYNDAGEVKISSYFYFNQQIKQQIEVEKLQTKKPYLGGYKNLKNNDIIYHNAFAQTDQYKREHNLKFHRDTQTYEYSTKSSKVMREIGTQMERLGLYIDVRKDKEMEPQAYFSSEMWQERREEAALFIQRMMRGMLARMKCNHLKRQKEKERQEQLMKEEEFRKKAEVKHKQEIERRMHPRTKDDFNILFDELELWRVNEIQKIKLNEQLNDIEKKIALKQVLDKETELLQTIDRLKIIANKENKEEKIKQFLKSMADPKKWERTDGRYTEVHTPFTIRAKELMDIYYGLKLRKISIDERLDILLNTKWTVNQYDEELTREIQELIDREADMINRGRSEQSLEGLRQRLQNLFLQFIETPNYNPEASRFQKLPIELLMFNATEKN